MCLSGNAQSKDNSIVKRQGGSPALRRGKMKTNIRLKGLLSAALISGLALGAASCGGGSGAPAPDQNDGPAAGFADLTGQLTQGSGSRPVSTVGSPLPGVITSLINAGSGAVSGSDVTDSQGNFEIKNVPSGTGYLVK